MKLTKLALAAGVLSLGISTAHAQTYKTDFSTGIVLTSGTNTTNTLSLNFGALANKPLALSFPNGDTAGTYVLTSDGAGNLIWSGNAGNIILGGDATGPASNNIVNSASGPLFTVSHDISAHGGMHLTGNDTVGGNLDIAGGSSIVGNDTVLGTLYANGNANIDAAAAGNAGTITIGNSGNGGASPDSSVTTMNGAVNFTGPVNIPAGDLNLGLADDHFYIGSLGGAATPQTITQDVKITDAGVATVLSANGNFAVGGGQHVAGADTVGGNLDIAGGSSIVGNDTVLGTLYANGNANIDAAAAGNAGTITIGNSGNGGASPDSSVTTMNGAVNFTGPVNIPAGDLNLGLADDHFYIGSLGGAATPQTITQDVKITDAGVATVLSANGNFAVGGGQHVAGADTVGGNLDIAGGSSIVGNDTVLGTLYANGNANIDAAAAGNAGTITIGNSGNGGASPDSSVTTMNGAVNFTGPVNIPAGDLNLGLADDHFYIGSLGGAATPQTITQDVKITDAGVATVLSANGNFAVGGGQHVAGADTVGGNLDIAGGSSIVGNDTVLGTLYANGNANIDAAAAGNAGTITIGNSGNGGASPDSSVTTMNGAVNFTGPVNIPAGDLNLGLADDHFYIGSLGGAATPQTITQDVKITDAGVATVLSANGNFAVGGGANVHGNDTVVGQSTLGSTALSNGTVAAAATMALDGLHSYYSLTGTNPVSIGAITGAPAGQILVFVNTGTANFTLTGAGLLGAGTGDVIMTPGGSATLIYDGSNWHLLASN